MHNLQNILEKEYKKKSSAQNFETLVDLIEEIFEIDINEAPAVTGAPDVSQLDDRAAQQMILKMIPDIAVSEIGWSDVSTNDKGDAISGPQRQLLVQFLK